MLMKFIGRNGSMGLKKGGIYNLEAKISAGQIIVYKKTSEGMGARCPYDTLEAFLKNWEVLYSDGKPLELSRIK